MKKIKWQIIAISVLIVVCLLTGCAGEQGAPEAEKSEEKAGTEEAVVADGLAEISVEGETDLPGNFFLSFVYSRNLIMLDGKGNIVWSKHEEQPSEDAQTGFWDFKKHEIDGKTYYSYHDQTGAYEDFDLRGYAPGERVILDEDFNEVKRITAEASDVTDKGTGIDGHDFLLIDLDHYILSCYVRENVKNVPGYPDGTNVIYSYLQEVKDGEVVWDWKTIDYPELYDIIATDATPTAADFDNKEVDAPDIVHFNAMRLNDDGDLVCSFRHLNTIMCLDRTKDKEQIKWKLSGKADEFGLTEQQKTSGQHYVTVDGNRIMVFNNGNRDQQTEVRSYSIDFDAKKADLVRSYGFNGKFSQACGAVQNIKDDLYMIGWGWATTDDECMSVIDFATGEKKMSVRLGNPQNITYRCVYYE
ncbi:MAG: aryl-sulfate sulfotransferase [Eubacterium sp.]|nr:aryl-sulfate sulfotransferase [Eubacterium sp.]